MRERKIWRGRFVVAAGEVQIAEVVALETVHLGDERFARLEARIGRLRVAQIRSGARHKGEWRIVQIHDEARLVERFAILHLHLIGLGLRGIEGGIEHQLMADDPLAQVIANLRVVFLFDPVIARPRFVDRGERARRGLALRLDVLDDVVELLVKIARLVIGGGGKVGGERRRLLVGDREAGHADALFAFDLRTQIQIGADQLDVFQEAKEPVELDLVSLAAQAGRGERGPHILAVILADGREIGFDLVAPDAVVALGDLAPMGDAHRLLVVGLREQLVGDQARAVADNEGDDRVGLLLVQVERGHLELVFWLAAEFLVGERVQDGVAIFVYDRLAVLHLAHGVEQVFTAIVNAAVEDFLREPAGAGMLDVRPRGIDFLGDRRGPVFLVGDLGDLRNGLRAQAVHHRNRALLGEGMNLVLIEEAEIELADLLLAPVGKVGAGAGDGFHPVDGVAVHAAVARDHFGAEEDELEL